MKNKPSKIIFSHLKRLFSFQLIIFALFKYLIPEPQSQASASVPQTEADLNNNATSAPVEPQKAANIEAAVLQPQVAQVMQAQQQHESQNTQYAQPSDKIWCRFLIPSKVAGAIIGRGGATIRALREEVRKQIACGKNDQLFFDSILILIIFGQA